MLTYILFLVGFYALIKGADWLVEGASAVARRYHVSPLVIGLTIVAFGTSAPEFLVTAIATFNGNTDIAIGNILGSNIANVLLILGISSMVYPLVAQQNTVRKEIPFALLAGCIVAFAANDVFLNGATVSALGRGDGLILLSFFVVFLYYTFGIARVQGTDATATPDVPQSVMRSIAGIVGGLVFLVVGGKWIVDGAVSVANLLGLSEAVIGLTVIAIGTSLPELATSVVAALKKQSDIAIGNVVGSNIFNVFFILGFSATVEALPFPARANADILMVILSSLLLFVVMYIGKRHTIERWQGGVMVCAYIAYIAYLVMVVS